jgi:hypothetical protein
MGVALASASIAIVSGCGSSGPYATCHGRAAVLVTEPSATPASVVTQDVRSVGVAEMLADGTIKLTLRAEGPGGAVGDALRVIPPTDPEYASIKKHLDPIGPGDRKPVAPFQEH